MARKVFVVPGRFPEDPKGPYIEPPMAKGWIERRNAWLESFFETMKAKGCAFTTHDNPGVFVPRTKKGSFTKLYACPVSAVAVFMQTVEIRYRDPHKPTLTLDFGAKHPFGRKQARK